MTYDFAQDYFGLIGRTYADQTNRSAYSLLEKAFSDQFISADTYTQLLEWADTFDTIF